MPNDPLKPLTPLTPLTMGEGDGSVRLDNPLVLAPLAGHTDRAFRGLVRGLGGPGLVVTEMVSSEGLTRGSEFSRDLAQLDPDERPVGIQIFGCDPERMADAAAIVEDLGADLVDVNMGCPVPKVTRHGSGAAMMRNPAHAAKVIEKMVSRATIPVTVKIRSGWDHDSINASEVARALEGAGAAAVTVHPRCRSVRHRGEAAWSVIRDVKQSVSIPVIGNGDVHDLDSAKKMLESTGADGIMIGRGALGNPWVFRQVTDGFLGKPTPKTTLEDYRILFDELVERLCEYQPERRVLNRLKAFIGWVTKGLHGGTVLRQDVYQTKCLGEARATLARYFDAAGSR